MMRFCFLLTGLLLTASSVAQIDRRQADSLLRVINSTRAGAERIEALLRLAEFHVFKPGELATDLDSAKFCLEEAGRLNKIVRSTTLAGQQLLIKGYLLREKGLKPAGRQTLEQAIPLLEKGNDKTLLGKAYFELQGYYDYWDSAGCLQRIRLTDKAVQAFGEGGDMESKAHALRMLGDLYGLNREFAKANDVLHRALSVYDSINHRQLQGIYELMGRNYYQLGDFKHAIQYALQSLKTAQAVQDSSMQLATIHNTLGLFYRGSGRSDLAIGCFKNGLSIAELHHDTATITNFVYNIGLCYIDLHQPRQLHDLLASISPGIMDFPATEARTNKAILYLRACLFENHIAAAYKYCMMMEELLKTPNLYFYIKQDLYFNLTWYYLQAHDIKKARFYVNKSLDLEQSAYSRESPSRQLLLYKVDSAEGNYKAAFDHLRAFKIGSDSIFNVMKFRQLQQLEVEFETSKKADSILLLTQKTELQTANLQRAGLAQNFTIGGILLALVIIGLLYRQYQLKQRNNKAMAQKNERLEHLVTEKEWLLKEVHHRVKNNLQTIMSLLELQLDTVSRDAQYAIQTSQNRIYTTSLLHQKLYRSENLSSVNMQAYLTELVAHLRDALGADNRILFNTNIAPVELDVTQGVPIGLIVNEVVTNSLKYAFHENIEQPEIIVSLTTSGDMADLLIADNGKGFSSVSDNNLGLGLKLVKGLAEDIDGHISISADDGTSVLIRFRPRLSLANNFN